MKTIPYATFIVRLLFISAASCGRTTSGRGLKSTPLCDSPSPQRSSGLDRCFQCAQRKTGREHHDPEPHRVNKIPEVHLSSEGMYVTNMINP